ncbi:hypothetical protein [Nonomuraea sp. NPDC048916]|uniref:hypothetical protein n=1 Tax=Nonomuraea sp. NPDC048916 TaxID=3154232 RepID=UPI0033FAFFE4
MTNGYCAGGCEERRAAAEQVRQVARPVAPSQQQVQQSAAPLPPARVAPSLRAVR